jgi:hypothetical protein
LSFVTSSDDFVLGATCDGCTEILVSSLEGIWKYEVVFSFLLVSAATSSRDGTLGVEDCCEVDDLVSLVVLELCVDEFVLRSSIASSRAKILGVIGGCDRGDLASFLKVEVKGLADFDFRSLEPLFCSLDVTLAGMAAAGTLDLTSPLG